MVSTALLLELAQACEAALADLEDAVDDLETARQRAEAAKERVNQLCDLFSLATSGSKSPASMGT